MCACLSGVLSLEDGLSLVSMRGRLMDQMPAGAMLAVPLSEQKASDVPGRRDKPRSGERARAVRVLRSAYGH